MVYTVTLNPSIDYVVRLDDFVTGCVNRAADEAIYPGGKGMNVSIVLKRLGVDTKALGIAAGFTGKEIVRLLDGYGVESDFVFLDGGISRINVKLSTGEETEINGRGPIVSADDILELTNKLSALGKDDVLVLSGSLAPSMTEDTYKTILESVKQTAALTVVDTSGAALLHALSCRPFLIKPNKDELSKVTNTKLLTDDDVVAAARSLQSSGARNVLVSMDARGAVLVCENGTVTEACAPRGEVINSVGAGDSMVAGFIAGYLKYKNSEMALKSGIAAGSACAFSPHLPTKAQVDALFKEALI